MAVVGVRALALGHHPIRRKDVRHAHNPQTGGVTLCSIQFNARPNRRRLELRTHRRNRMDTVVLQGDADLVVKPGHPRSGMSMLTYTSKKLSAG